jgi:4-hydroxybenzoate polyprenyltransferase
MKIGEAIHLYITVSRWEFLPAVFIGVFIGILIGARSVGSILAASSFPFLLEGILIFILLFNVGFMVNCWADWKVDELYKTRLYQAVKKLGRRSLGVIIIIHILLSFVLAFHLSIVLQRIEISILVWIGTFLGVGYSIEPIRFKKRGVLHSIVAIPIFFIPGVYSFFLVSSLSITDLYTIFFLLAAIGITIGHYALILISQAEDQPDDKKMGLLTPAVKWGLYKTIRLSFLFNVIGSILTILALIGLFLLINIWLCVLVPIVALGRFFSFKEVYALMKLSTSISSETIFLQELRQRMPQYPLWHAYGLSGITISGLCILLAKSFGLVQPVL